MQSKDGIKMKKAILVTLLSSAALMLFAAPADAKEKETKTDVGVSFKDDSPTISPEDMKPFKNNLAVVWKPASFQFGEQKAVAGTAIFNNVTGDNGGLATANNTDKSQYLVVNDDRELKENKNSTWALKANMSELVTTDGATKLDAAKLSMELNAPKMYNIGNVIGADNDYEPVAPWDAAALTDFDAKSGVELAPTATLEAASTSKVDIVTKKTANDFKGGVATTIQNVKLYVNDANQNGKAFTGTITWTLDDAPTFS